MSKRKPYVIPSDFAGTRLDRVLAEILPESSLRLRRRLCDDGRVLVGGNARKPGFKVRAEQEVVIVDEAVKMSAEELGVYVVEQTGRFAAVFKPGGVHSAAIAGKDAPCVEPVLPELFPDADPVLLNRLDKLTSGLLLVGLREDGVAAYQDMEAEGDIRKFYLATVEGRLDGVVTVRSALDTDDRKKTRVLDKEDADARRWTDVEALMHDHDRDTTLVRCLIMKGARHQIRAHLASIDHPIVGDPLYGGGRVGDRLRLHHWRVEFPGFSAEVPDKE